MNEKNIGSIISKLREEKGLTQKDLADKLNVSDKAISKWETGANLPSIDMIYNISVIFKVSFQNLLRVRLEDEHVDEKVINNIMNEFDENNYKKKAKRIKIALVIVGVVALALAITLIFTRTFNRFAVYDLNIENNDLSVSAIYIETRLRDKFIIDDLRIRNYEIKSSDTVSVDIYFMEDNENKIIYTNSNLQYISFSDYQTYIKIEDLSKYKDNLYLKVTIVDSKNKITEYVGKFDFTKEFSNNKIYDSHLENSYDKNKIYKIDKDLVKEKLIELKFEDINNNLVKNTKNYKIIYYYDSNKISYRYEKNKLSYRYNYNLDDMTLEVIVFDDNNVEIDNYKYNVAENKIISCITGSCNNYVEAMKLLKENVLNYLYD